MRLAVIGGGAAAVSLLDSLLLRHGELPAGLELVVYEPGEPARGRAYRDDLECALVNRQAGYMSIRCDERRHFLDWLAQHPRQPGEIAVESFVPRGLFGRYLSDQLTACRAVAGRLGWPVEIRREAASAVARSADGLVVRAESGSETYDHVTLCVGTGEPADPYRLAGAPAFLPDPYPLSQVLPQVSRSAHVLVLGSGLSAVDAVLGLLHLGHQGPITMGSRRGVLPGVRTPQRTHELTHVTTPNIEALTSHTGRLRLADVWRLLQAELAEAGVDVQEETRWLRPGAPAAARLRHQLAQDGHDPFQTILMTILHQQKERIWNALPGPEKHRMVATYNTRLKSLYNPMPPSSARTLLGTMDSGQLAVISDVRSVRHSAGRFTVLASDPVPDADVVIDTTRTGLATTSGRARPLLSSLVANGLAVPNPHGGLRVAGTSGRLLGPGGAVSPGLSAIGEITSGDLYYASSLFAINRGADQVTELLTSMVLT
jgi:uncharacterized NAD(P)/FAD-binding protein YdhS